MKKTSFILFAAAIAAASIAQEKKVVDKTKEVVKKDSVYNPDNYVLKAVITLDTAYYFAIKRVIGNLPISSGFGRIWEALDDTANVKGVRIKKPTN